MLIPITMRRHLLDRCLSQNISKFKGDILDIGGIKKNRRGKFKIPAELYNRWYTLNNSKDTNPDYLQILPKINIDKKFRTIIMTEVIEYIEDIDLLLLEIDNITDSESRIFISSPFLHPLHGDKDSDYYRLTESILIKKLEKHFTILQLERMGGLFSCIYDLLRTQLELQQGKSIFTKLAIKIIKLASPVFVLIDHFFKNRNMHINTGFWIELTKKQT